MRIVMISDLETSGGAAIAASRRSGIIASPLLHKINTDFVTQSLSNTLEDVQSLTGERPANFF